MKRYSNIIGFDDTPFSREQRNVKIIGAVYAGLRFDGVLIGEIDKDGSDAAATIARLISESKFARHVQLIMLQGITMAGFNVVDVFHLNAQLDLPVLVVARNKPNLEAIREALHQKIPGGESKWHLIEELGPMEPVGNVFAQSVGLAMDEAAQVIDHFAIHSQIPEPIRTAHLIAGAIANGQSRGDP